MFSADRNPDRTWQEIAEEASRERDPKRLNELAKELSRALDRRDGKFSEKKAPKRESA